MRGLGADRDALRRAANALLRRGFGWDSVRSAQERYLAEMEFDE